MNLITDHQLKKELGISESTIRRYIESGIIPLPFKLGAKKYWLKEDLENFFKSLAEAARS
ncbi:helix-turn-helix domain-containing protein [Aliiglaciecola sp. 2_MG-2023]|uniref:helix-turn-helix transcriptional regulator n=1 Tax=unclassified Aliiglaciecola TaxID=2593648 RepID=UPI0026E2F9C5|nr:MULTISPECIES: helix-turn-helix domain-containing protein [unclassified Aliiglaciecola]MDO6710362.1 helix-turn-helix domain-containing protein [Aliiglaciecola sp. 2_MG-2023]MDO6751509.1 helix-turn-helix domain-containing protein [Aliiglaciecola sp. 1_MG-2023]